MARQRATTEDNWAVLQKATVTATEEEAWKEPTRARTKKDTSEKMTKQTRQPRKQPEVTWYLGYARTVQLGLSWDAAGTELGCSWD